MPDETPKRTIPRLRPKQRDLTQLDPNSLTAALYHRELLAQLGPPVPDPAASAPTPDMAMGESAAPTEAGPGTAPNDQPASVAPRPGPTA
jgi:hypothetical protein